MDEVVEMLADVYRRRNGLAFPVSGTGHSGMEAGIANLVVPGDTVIAGVAGFFGGRIAEMAERWGAEVVRVEVEWGRHIPPELLLVALRRRPEARLLPPHDADPERLRAARVAPRDARGGARGALGAPRRRRRVPAGGAPRTRFRALRRGGRRLPQLTSVVVREGLDAGEVQGRVLREHGIEIGGGLGPAAGRIWRIGLMGTNATRETADRVLAALDAVT